VTTSTDEDNPERVGDAASATLGKNLLGLLGKLRIDLSAWRHRVRLRRLTSSSMGYLLLVAVIAAICGTGILLILNAEAQLSEKQDYSVLMPILFVTVLVIYRITQRLVLQRACDAIERALDESRTRIVGKVMKLSLRDVEDMTPGRLVDGLARHYEVLSQTVLPLAWGFESLILSMFMLAYLFYLSVIAGLLTVFITGLLVVGYIATSTRLETAMAEARKADANLSRLSEDIVAGFKELRLNSNKNAAVRDDFSWQSHQTSRHRREAGSIVSELFVNGNSASYLMAAGVIFVLPILSSGEQTDISRIVTAVIFLIGPIGGLVGAAQQFATARFVLNGIDAFETEVDNADQELSGVDKAAEKFEKIEINNLHYKHEGASDDGSGFALSDIDFDLAPGQVVFITGANGSGKTTALRLLSGLYPPHGGQILLNGRRLPSPAPQSYRELFATVFADFHIFHKPYALDDEAIARLEAMLEKLNIRNKLPADLRQGYEPDRLSTGQRKRLALALALAEDRPILLLDEWAADQDPATREDFYYNMLSVIKAQGKAVIAVSHDERYFDCADVRYHMEDGQMVRISG